MWVRQTPSYLDDPRGDCAEAPVHSRDDPTKDGVLQEGDGDPHQDGLSAASNEVWRK